MCDFYICKFYAYAFYLFCRLDKTKFYVVGAGLFTGLTVGLYPVSVIKTRLQVASGDAIDRSAFSVIKGLLKTDGIPGLYRGFGTVITGAVPARIIFLTALETTKVAAFKMVEPFKLSEPTEAAIANGIAGMTSALFSQAVFVPIDVVCCSCSFPSKVLRVSRFCNCMVSLGEILFHLHYRILKGTFDV